MVPETESQLEAAIQANITQNAEYQAQLTALRNQTPLERLAIAMFRGTHDPKLETDWWYHYENGVPKWAGDEQPRWLRKARELILVSKLNVQTLGELINFFENYRK